MQTEFRFNPTSERFTLERLRDEMTVAPRLRRYIEANSDDFFDEALERSTDPERIELLELLALMSVEPLARFGIRVGVGEA